MAHRAWRPRHMQPFRDIPDGVGVELRGGGDLASKRYKGPTGLLEAR